MLDSKKLSVAAVILDQALDDALDYLIPQDLLGKLHVGMRVKVPVKTSLRLATVFEVKNSSAFLHLKPITEILSEKPFISSELFALARWMSHYYCCPLRKVLRSI